VAEQRVRKIQEHHMTVDQRESGLPVDSEGPAVRPAAYRRVRENVVRLVSEHRTAIDRTVPACPAWTVRDLVEHLTGNCLKAVRRAKGQEPAVEPPPSAQTADVAELLGYWEKQADRLEPIVAPGAEVGRLLRARGVRQYQPGRPLQRVRPVPRRAASTPTRPVTSSPGSGTTSPRCLTGWCATRPQPQRAELVLVVGAPVQLEP
jgi:hypothetical protein